MYFIQDIKHTLIYEQISQANCFPVTEETDGINSHFGAFVLLKANLYLDFNSLLFHVGWKPSKSLSFVRRATGTSEREPRESTGKERDLALPVKT